MFEKLMKNILGKAIDILGYDEKEHTIEKMQKCLNYCSKQQMKNFSFVIILICILGLLQFVKIKIFLSTFLYLTITLFKVTILISLIYVSILKIPIMFLFSLGLSKKISKEKS